MIEDDISKNFTITENFADFYVIPGFIITDEDFFIEIRNLKDTEINVGVSTSNETAVDPGFFGLLEDPSNENTISLGTGETKRINFNVNDLEEFGTIKLNTENTNYEIPFNIFSKEEDKSKKAKNLRFEPAEIGVSIATNSESTKIIYLRNNGNETIEDI